MCAAATDVTSGHSKQINALNLFQNVGNIFLMPPLLTEVAAAHVVVIRAIIALIALVGIHQMHRTQGKI